MKTKRRQEGYLLIDNRCGPGVTEEFVRQSGKAVPFAPEGKIYESAFYTCAHCCATVVINPQRTRERAWCQKCDRYICDACGFLMQTHGCQNIDRTLDTLQEQAFRALGKD